MLPGTRVSSSRLRFAAVLTLGAMLTGATAAEAQTTALRFDSDPGDYIVQGVDQTITPAQATFQIASNFANGVSVSVTGPGFSFWWRLDFAAAGNQPLAVGAYESAQRFPFVSGNGLDVGGSGRGCNRLTGRYVVREIELHTIVWTVTDSDGATSGLGSRYFRVSNGATGSVTAATAAFVTQSLAVVALDPSPIAARRGWEADAPWQSHAPGRSGRTVLRGEEIDRFELALGEHEGQTYAGYLRVGDTLSALPVGSRLDSRTGLFTWSPGVGFVGNYDLVFVRSNGAQTLARQEVRIVLQPKGSGHVGAQVVIDTPRSQQDVAQPFVLGGWAADLDASAGTGIDTLHVWAYPLTGGPPVFLGTATYAGARPDVAAIHGAQFRDSGFGLVIQGLTPGNYDLAVFAWSSVSGGFVPAQVARVTVR